MSLLTEAVKWIAIIIAFIIGAAMVKKKLQQIDESRPKSTTIELVNQANEWERMKQIFRPKK